MSFDLREYRQRPRRVGSLLQWDALDPDTPWVLYQRNNTLLAVLSFRGQDMESAEDAVLVAQASQLNQTFRRFGGGWGLMSEARHQPVTAYPESHWPDRVSAAVDAERRAFFTQPGQHFETVTWLTLVWKIPPQRGSSWWARLLYEELPEASTPEQWAIETFRDECIRTRDLLQGCCEAVTFLEGAALLTYLHSCVTLKRHVVRVPSPACYLNTYLTQDLDVHVGLSEVVLGPVEAPEAVIACVSPVPQHGQPAFPNESYPGILGILQALSFEWRCTVRYLPLARHKAAAELRKYALSHAGARQKGLRKKGSTVVEKVAEERSLEASTAQANVEHGHYSAGPLTMTVVVWDADRAALAHKVQQVEATLNTEQFVCKRETYNTAEAWLGTMPGNTLANVRKPILHSYNFAHLFPATAVWQGQPWNMHLDGPPLLLAVGKHHTPVGLSLHEGDVAHTGVIGSTGDGKSTLLNLLCLQARRYPGQEVNIFDKAHAARKLTAAVGGMWYDLGRTPLQPLANLDQPYEIAWSVDWLEALLLQERMTVTPDIKADVHAALVELATWDTAKRTMTSLTSLVEHPMARQALKMYTMAGPYGQMTDGDHDSIADHPWCCFEMSTILQTPRLLGAILPALFHRLEQRLTGVPVLYVLHEAWIAFDTPYWAERLRGWLKGLRARNGSVAMASQSLSDAVNSPIMGALLDNVATWILTPNRKAETQEIGKYYEAVGLNARQLELLATSTKKQDYYVLQDSGQALVQLHLGPLALALCGTPDPAEVAALEQQITTYGSEFAEVYLREKGLTL
jgi:type IV secretion/conjugal transfer VirB4 family ATPase